MPSSVFGHWALKPGRLRPVGWDRSHLRRLPGRDGSGFCPTHAQVPTDRPHRGAEPAPLRPGRRSGRSTILNRISDTLVAGDREKLHGFGAFSVEFHGARIGRNLRAGRPKVATGRALSILVYGARHFLRRFARQHQKHHLTRCALQHNDDCVSTIYFINNDILSDRDDD